MTSEPDSSVVRLPAAASMHPAAVSSMAIWPVRHGPRRATDVPAASEPNIAARYNRLIWKPTPPAGTPSASAIFGAIVGTTSTAMVPTAWIAVVSASRPARLGRGASVIAWSRPASGPPQVGAAAQRIGRRVFTWRNTPLHRSQHEPRQFTV